MSRARRQKCLQIRDRLYPVDQWPGTRYEREVIRAGGAERTLLEIGCARHAPRFNRIARHYRTCFGLDLETLYQFTETRRLLVQGDAHCLPFGSGSIDTVAMIDVVEHLAEPQLVFSECARVLKPKGRLIVSTVNKYFPVVALARLVPVRLRKTLNRVMTGTRDEDTFRAYYRANTARELRRAAHEAGLVPIDVSYVSHHPTYLLFSALIYRFGVVVEQAIRRIDGLSGWRHLIQAVFERPAADGHRQAARIQGTGS